MNTILTNTFKRNWRDGLIFAGGLVALLATWLLLYFALLALTKGILVPWDIVPGRPPLGIWQCTVNDQSLCSNHQSERTHDATQDNDPDFHVLHACCYRSDILGA